MRILLVVVLAYIGSCTSRERVEVVADQVACTPTEVLDALGAAIESGNPELIRGVAVTADDLVWLMNRADPDEPATAAENDAVFSSLRQMVTEWHKSIEPGRYSSRKLGARQQTSIEGVSEAIDVVEDSELVFSLSEGSQTVSVDKLLLVKSCWKIGEISYPEVVSQLDEGK